MKKNVFEKNRLRAEKMFKSAGIVMTDEENANIEVADFGLDNIDCIGLQLVIYANSELYCAKEMALFPHQTCPEHIHIPFGTYKGKTETFRCRYGTVRLFVDGEATDGAEQYIPSDGKEYFTVKHMILLKPGEQYTIKPGTKHWFTSGDEGAVVSEFSTQSFDEYDVFTDPRIKRIPEIIQED